MPKFQSTKLIEGFSTCFRQWKAVHTHCAMLHGYAISFDVKFEGELDQYNWVQDFGFMKRSKNRMSYTDRRSWIYDNNELTPSEWFSHVFDHTVVIAEDDPEREYFEQANEKGILRLRVLRQVGCEMFAKYVADNLNEFLYKETQDRVRVVEVKCFEHPKNSAIYIP